MATKKKSKEKSDGVNRRGFLKGAGYTAAGAAIVGSGLIPASGKPAQTSDPAAARQTITKDGRTITVLGGDSGLSAKEALAAAREIGNTYPTSEVVAAYYQKLADDTGADARLVADAAQLQKDQATLESLISPDYTFTDPFGVARNRDSTIADILAGKVKKSSFEYPEETIQIFGNTAVTSGVFAMKGSIGPNKRDISGRYRTTHTYTKVKGQWRVASSHMSKEAGS